MDVYNEPASLPITTAGVYNEDALDSNDDPFIQLLPANNWTSVTGRSAKGATAESFVGIADNNNRLTRKNIGGTATMRIQVPGGPDGGSATLALNVFKADKLNSDKLLVCVLNGTAFVDISPSDLNSPCATLDTLRTSANQVITLDNPGGSPITYTVFFQTLTAGFFRIDGFHIVYDGILTGGIYDNHFMSENGLIDLNGDWQLPPASGTKVNGSFGGQIIRTQDPNANLIFHFTGSGFALVTEENSNRLDIEVCFVPEADYVDETDFDDTELAFCRFNSTELTSTSAKKQYGVTFYGLTPDTYAVRVQVNEVPTNLTSQWLKVDAIVIFEGVTSGGPLQTGMYDDAQLMNHDAVRFAPTVFWTQKPKVKSGPPKGPWQLTQQEAKNSGTVVQVFVEGNTLILYQEFSGSGSGNIQACLIVDGADDNELLCNNFSQKGKGGYLTPVAFFGLGEGQHQIVIENKDPGRKFTIDAIRVTS